MLQLLFKLTHPIFKTRVLYWLLFLFTMSINDITVELYVNQLSKYHIYSFYDLKWAKTVII